jgi:phosphate uptake regulator
LKRKVIQIANSTQLVSLPRKWALKHGIKKGDELDVEEEGNKIIVESKKGSVLKKTELNITNLDRSSIMYYVRSAYRLGYDEIDIKFDNTSTPHLRLNKKVNVLSVVHIEVNRLVGLEIIKQKENFCQIKMISEGSINEFASILRRIFLLLKDANNDFTEGTKKNNHQLLETIEEKHNTITKFVSYCLRLLNKYGYVDPKNTTVMYHILASIDKITDIIKYGSRDMLNFNKEIKKETKDILDFMNNCVNSYVDLFYKFEINKIVDFTGNRDKVRKMIKNSLKKISPEEIRLLGNMEEVSELLLDLVESRMSLVHQSNKV